MRRTWDWTFLIQSSFQLGVQAMKRMWHALVCIVAITGARVLLTEAADNPASDLLNLPSDPDVATIRKAVTGILQNTVEGVRNPALQSSYRALPSTNTGQKAPSTAAGYPLIRWPPNSWWLLGKDSNVSDTEQQRLLTIK